MPPGYVFLPQPNDVAKRGARQVARGPCSALTLDIELFSQAHYRASIEPDPNLSELWKDVFLFHWKEESQHAILDELEWRREDARVTEAERDQGVNDLIDLVAAVDGIAHDAGRARMPSSSCRAPGACSRADEAARCATSCCKAYRWQYITSGAQEPRFADVLQSMVTPAQMERIGAALAPILADA